MAEFFSHLKENILKGNITWPEIGQQTNEAKNGILAMRHKYASSTFAVHDQSLPIVEMLKNCFRGKYLNHS